ncbi:pilus motility taxis protein HmpF [Okeanomitos corallinicola TIOX110]|uniref:Pilus motility taxis protein HmpF n=1 Tax=Okeanomitos corallinicola TIOX110 TaxID=3133117 RepID=A0ABZ2UQ98_9CYAN
MLYLAEVQKQKVGLLGGGSKTELKLLACQRSDQNWNNVSEDIIAAEEASKLNDGALVLVELSPNRQVQRIQEAGRPLVNILQNFSRQVEKFKLKEDEIDQWKQSLMFQVQELNRREMDMESRWEQLQNLESEVDRLEEQKQEVESSREEIEQLKAEVERKSQELEGAWEHLRGEQSRLDELKADSAQAAVLDEAQSTHIVSLLDRLSNGMGSTAILQENLNLVFELVEQQQGTLNPHWQQLESERNLAQQQQGEIDQLSQTLSDRQSELQQFQSSLESKISQLQLSQTQLDSKKEFSLLLEEQKRSQENLYQNGKVLVAMLGNMSFEPYVDVEALQNLPMEELQKQVQDLQNKLEIDSSFVRDQEQELNFKDQFIKELEAKIKTASEDDKKRLELELAEEQDLYQMLNKSLKPQRNNLFKQDKIFKEHQNVLMYRQGHSVTNTSGDNTAELKSILAEIEKQQEKYSQELQNLETEIQQLTTQVESQQGEIDQQTNELESKRQEIKSLTEQLLNLQTANAECLGKVNLYQETLQPIQDCLDGIRDKLTEISNSLNDVQTTGDSQIQAVSEMRETLQGLISSTELLAS